MGEVLVENKIDYQVEVEIVKIVKIVERKKKAVGIDVRDSVSYNRVLTIKVIENHLDGLADVPNAILVVL